MSDHDWPQPHHVGLLRHHSAPSSELLEYNRCRLPLPDDGDSGSTATGPSFHQNISLGASFHDALFFMPDISHNHDEAEFAEFLVNAHLSRFDTDLVAAAATDGCSSPTLPGDDDKLPNFDTDGISQCFVSQSQISAAAMSGTSSSADDSIGWSGVSSSGSTLATGLQLPFSIDRSELSTALVERQSSLLRHKSLPARTLICHQTSHAVTESSSISINFGNTSDLVPGDVFPYGSVVMGDDRSNTARSTDQASVVSVPYAFQRTHVTSSKCGHTRIQPWTDTSNSSVPTSISEQHPVAQSHLPVSQSNLMNREVLCKVSAKRGCATDPRSIAERMRRTRINEGLKKLQEIVPNADKYTNYIEMLDEAFLYIKHLQRQVEALSADSRFCAGTCHSGGSTDTARK